ncbi:hypothetical protein MPDQ_003372 [Monascus purpureus]|uniref:CCAAT-binding factor domain-containing protein n=1 Tax=Monascus purpureus TaxID=5098 RepID=A0A507QND4_MONPU|nr:hypothetical protein MPDQ_003372 [Monascus purpureus]BDD54732.1 hypothetical protein MAP00_000325 [Monascus purpureus]
MAKNKGKRSSRANTDIPNGGVSLNNESNNTGGADALPKLDESAFAGLRQKIEQRLKSENESKQRKLNNNNKSKKDADKDPSKKKNEDSKKPGSKEDSTKGKKRDRNGEVIAREDKNNDRKGQSTSKDGNEDDDLRREILALGGTEEDFDLLANVDSESEVEAATDASVKSKNKTDETSLRNELAKILEAAGHVVPDDVEDEDENDDEDNAEDEDESAEYSSEAGGSTEDNISDVEEEVPSVAAPKAANEPAQKKKAAKESTPEPVLPKEYLKLAVRPRPDWNSNPLSPISSSSKPGSTLPRYLVDRVHQLAISLLETENKMYSEAQQASSSSAQKFYSTVMSSGTLSDKISALTLAVQESPLHNTKSLEILIGLGKKRSRAQAVEVLRSLKDMFSQGTILPSDRRLRSFTNQPSLVAAFQGVSSKWSERDPLPGGLQKAHLIVWAFEHFLKDQYFEVLKILEVWCNDEIEFSRSRAVSYVYELLKEKPEQEANLLRLLVNKLGDRSKKIASRASYLLLQLEQAHPLMKPTIISAVEELLFRPGQSQHAKYYAIITLNQTILSLKEEKIAVQLLDIYFSLFVILLKPAKDEKAGAGNKKHGKFAKGRKNQATKDSAKGQSPEEEMRDKLISGVLTGVNRAYPFTNSDSERLSKHIDTLFRITHSSNFNTSIQALLLIQQLTSSHQVAADRFYRTLYESLLDPRVATSSKQALYLNLLYKALKNDLNVRRVKAFVKRIVQILGLHQPSFICGIFYLIRELEKTFSGLQSLFDQPEDDDSDEEVFKDVPDEDDERQEQTEVSQTKPRKPSNGYDPRKRDPEHSNADKTCLWELLPYQSHFHPSVSVNATRLLQHETMSGKPDMTLHTLTHFLDRFVYRAPKASAPVRGASLMQPLAGGDTSDRLVATGKGGQQAPVNTEEFWRKKSDEVAVEDAFFHEYFSRVGKDTAGKEKKTKKSEKDPVDRDEEVGEDDESEIWKALVESRPELEADEDSDDDLDMDDLESAFDEEGGDDEGVIFNDESDEELEGFSEEGEEEEEEENEAEAKQPPASESKSKSKRAAQAESDEDDVFDMDVSDEEAFVDSDEEVPLDIDMDMDGGVELPKDDEDQSGRKKRRKLKHLPMFASADDYAALLAGEDDGL